MPPTPKPTPAPAPTPVPAGATKRCFVDPDHTPDQMGYALGIICGDINCTDIDSSSAGVSPPTAYWPNTIGSHCNWAYDHYARAGGELNETLCTELPNTVGKVYECGGGCTRCQMKADTTPETADAVLGYLCTGTLMGPLCAPINPGGANASLTPLQKASLVADLYYQPVACNYGPAACNFSGQSEIVQC